MSHLKMAQAALVGAAALLSVNCSAEEIDLSAYRIAFAEEFDFVDVSPWGEDGSRWIAHTPWNGDFGDARFTDPAPDFPFTVNNGILRIEARKNAEGTWESGLLAGVNRDWEGFSKRYGYFEARMKLPPGDGVWPAFWLNSREGVELDILEYYGHDDGQFSSVWHIWAEEDEGGHQSDINWKQVPPGSLTDSFNTYGVLVEPHKITFFFNREPTWEFEVPWDVNPSFFPLVNLALGSGWPIDNTPDPSYLYVDYVRVYESLE